MSCTPEQAKKHLRNAGLAGCILAALTFLGCAAAALTNQTIDFNRWTSLTISIILTIWIFKGSRTASTWMFLWYLLQRLIRFAIFLPSWADIIALVFLYFFFQGARASFALHSINKQGCLPHEGSAKKSSPWFAASSLIAVISLTLLLSIRWFASYLNTVPAIADSSALPTSESSASREYPLHFAVANGDIAAIDRLLSEGHDINLNSPISTPLCIAAAAGRPGVITHLIVKGAAPNQQDFMGWRPLHHAIYEKRANLEAIEVLVMNGAEVDGKDKHLRTALHRAAQFGHAEAVRLLLSLGAQPNTRDENGLTPYDRAEKQPEIQEIFMTR